MADEKPPRYHDWLRSAKHASTVTLDDGGGGGVQHHSALAYYGPATPSSASAASAAVWTPELILRTIDEYKARPVLWDPSNEGYKLAPTKMRAWLELSEVVGLPVLELKRKISSLMSSYRRERRKHLQVASAEAVADAASSSFEPNWIFYKALDFLNDVYQPKTTLNSKHGQDNGHQVTDNSDSDNVDNTPEDPTHYVLQMETGSGAEMTVDANKSASFHNHLFAVNPLAGDGTNLRKRRLKRLSSSSKYSKLGGYHADALDKFGEYLVGELRQMDSYSAAMVQKKISELIFEAKIGKFSEDVSLFDKDAIDPRALVQSTSHLEVKYEPDDDIDT